MLFALILITGGFLSSAYGSTSLILPMYIYPSSETSWAPIISAVAAYPTVKFYLIINPKDGPIKSQDGDYDNYKAAMALLRPAAAINKNVVLLGYIRTARASGPSANVMSDIDAWTLYPELLPDGIFFDEVPTSATESSYYQTLADHARTKISNAFVVLNPGTPPNSAYFSFADQVVVQETPASAGAYEEVRGVSASKFSAMLYNVGSDYYMQGNVTELKDAGYGSMYVTDADDSWDSLGNDWISFLEALSG